MAGEQSVPDEVNRQALLTALTTEHFTLQGARSATISESSARSAVFLGSLSASVVSMGFVSQASKESTFRVFALLVLPTIFLLGVFTFVRLVETSVEDLRYGRAINRIRRYYLQIAGTDARYFLLGAHDDAAGVLENMGLRARPIQLYMTSAAAIAVVNSVVGAAVVALVIGWGFSAPLAVGATVGLVVALASIAAQMRWSRRMHERDSVEALFPSVSAVRG
jgi:hypothetical protein